LTPEERADLTRLAPVLKESIRRLGGFGLPPTLVHGDLHPGNVAHLDGDLVFFDWTDACVSHPFIDLHSLRWERDESVRAQLLEAYMEPWEVVATPESRREAAALAAVVTPLHHAVSYQYIVAALEPSAKPELDATHSFLREALMQARAL
jgi:Ser/Thr protein kinase RdoA (MazF antagonist)